MTSAILLTIMRNEGFGLDTISCFSQLTLVITGLAFVDNTDTINNVKSVNKFGEDLLKNNKER